VTHNTKVIDGVTCVEVHDVVYAGGVLTEDTLDWFAQDKDGNVWYFGENTHELDGNEITSIDGSFKGGTNGAQPGIIMKSQSHSRRFLPAGVRSRQTPRTSRKSSA